MNTEPAGTSTPDAPRSGPGVYTARYAAWSVIAIVGAVLLGYWPAIGNAFLSDDFNMRVLFRATDAGPTLDWPLLLREWWSGWGGLEGAAYYRPLVTYSVLVDYAFWGTNPFGYHLTNLLLHTLNALLVAHIIMRIAGPGKRYPALLAAIIFALHPAHPEAVSWIAGRVDVLSAVFYLLTIRCYLAYRWSGRRRHLVFAIGAFVLGLGSKESAVTVPFVLLALDVCLKLSRGLPRWAYGARPAGGLFLVLIAAYLGFRYLALGGLSGDQDMFAPYRSLDALATTLQQTGTKLFMLLAPVNDALTPAPWPLVFRLVVVVLFVLPFIELLTHGRRSIPGPLTGLAMILFPLALVGHIHVDPSTLANSRVLYLPVAGLLVALYSGPWDPGVRHELRRLGAAQTAVLSLLLAACFFVVLRRNLVAWTEAGDLATRVVAEIDRVERATPPGKKIIVGRLPDTHHGAYVFRNGFLFSVLRPIHHRDMTRVYPLLDYFYARDPGMLRAMRDADTRIVIWDDAAGKLVDLPPDPPAPHRLTDRDLREWAELGGPLWRPEPGLERRDAPGGGITLVAKRAGVGLQGPSMRIRADELRGIRFTQRGPGELAIGWSTANAPDRFPSRPVVFLSPHEGERTVSLINHATWYVPSGPPVGRLRIAVSPVGKPVTLEDVALLRRLPRLPVQFAHEPIPVPAEADFAIPVLETPYRHFRIVFMQPAAPLRFETERDPATAAPLVVPRKTLAHLHRIARAIGPYEALVYIDAIEANGEEITTKARSRVFRLQFSRTGPGRVARNLHGPRH